MPQQTNLNVSPYFDDFDANNNFYRVLFKPGYPVQARELTTLQTILQNQVEKFGQHFFKEGAKVIPGNTTYIPNYNAVILNNTFLGIPIDAYVGQLVGTRITGSTSGVTAVVDNVLLSTDSERGSTTLYISYLSSSSQNNSTSQFLDGENLLADITILSGLLGNTSIPLGEPFASTIANGSNAVGSSFGISNGVYFIRGQFVNVENEILILDQYSNRPNYRVGFFVNEEIINSDIDESLNDNSQGFNNYAAPGADRLRISVSLFKKNIDDLNDSNFVELGTIRDGELRTPIETTEYSLIADEFARRTYQESGDYYISPFTISAKESLNDGIGNQGIFNPGQLTYNGSVPSDAVGIYEIGAGKAMVRGYEIETKSSTFIDFPKTRTTKTLLDQSIEYNTGSTFVLNRLFGSPTIGIGNTYTVSLRDSRVGSLRNAERKIGLSQTISPGKEIGVARVYDMRLESGSYDSEVPNLNRWNISLYDIQTTTEISLNEPVTLNAPVFIKGKNSGATAFLKESVSAGTALTVYQKSGDFILNESFYFDGIEDGRVAVAITNYGISDIKSVYGIVGSANTFSADILQSTGTFVGLATITESSYYENEFFLASNLSQTVGVGATVLYVDSVSDVSVGSSISIGSVITNANIVSIGATFIEIGAGSTVGGTSLSYASSGVSVASTVSIGATVIYLSSIPLSVVGAADSSQSRITIGSTSEIVDAPIVSVGNTFVLIGTASTSSLTVSAGTAVTFSNVSQTVSGDSVNYSDPVFASRVVSPNPIFPGSIVNKGNLVSYTTTTLPDPFFGRVVSVGSTHINIVGVSTVSNICDGKLPISLTEVSDFRVLTTTLEDSEDNTLYTVLPKSNISNVDLTDASLIIRKTYTVNIINNQLSSIITADTNESFLPFDEERYTLIRSDGQTEVLTSDKFALTSGSRELQIYNLGSNDNNATLVATLRKAKPKAKVKLKNRVNSIVIDKSSVSSSGIGSTTLNDGLSYGNYPYGTRVQDEIISLNNSDIIEVLGIYEASKSDIEPLAPTVILSTISGPESKTTDLIIGETFIGQSSGAVAVVAERINDVQISYIPKNNIRLIEGETLIFEESNIQSVVSTIQSNSFNIIDNFTSNNGQNGSFYDYGIIVRKSNSQPPIHKVKVYFSNGYYESNDDGDITTANSYNTFDYSKDIQSINSVRNTDIIDIRPKVSTYSASEGSRSPLEFYGRDFSASGNSATNILASDETILTSFSFYLPRIDRVFLAKDGSFQVKYGTPSEKPERPVVVDDAIEIATAFIPAYLYNVNDISFDFLQYKRYQMKDIKKLEDRIKNLEYYTTLSLLETDTSNLFISDSEGLNRFKSGFFVDNFTTTISQEEKVTPKNSIDLNNGELRPEHYTTSIDLQPYSSITLGEDPSVVRPTGINIRRNEDIVTLDYSETEWFRQSFGTRVESVTPFLIDFWEGTLELTPSSDTWIDNARISSRIIRQEGDFSETISRLSSTINLDPQSGFSPTLWGSWQTVWTGSTTGTQTRTGTRTVVVEQFDNKSIGDRVVSRDLIPFMRSRNITFSGKNLKPLTQLSAFFDGRDVTTFCTPKLIEISMISGTFQVGETVVGSIRLTGLDLGGETRAELLPNIRFRVSQPNHMEGPYYAPTLTYPFNPYDNSTIQGAYSSTSSILNVDLYSLSNQANGEFGGWIRTNMILVGQTSGAQATVSNNRLISDLSSNIMGSFFIPNPNILEFPKFESGSKTLRLIGSPVNELGITETVAEEIFSSQGTLETIQEEIISVRNARITSETITQQERVTRQLPPPPRRTSTPPPRRTDPDLRQFIGSANISLNATGQTEIGLQAVQRASAATGLSVSQVVALAARQNLGATPLLRSTVGSSLQNRFDDSRQQTVAQAAANLAANPLGSANNPFFRGPVRAYNGPDPLAQTFYVSDTEGVFLTRCEVFFRTVDDSNIPVILQIRTVELGIPTQRVLPFSEIVLDPSQINTSGDGSVATSFTFKAPVYLEGGKEYAVVLISNSTKYSVYISRVGENDLITQEYISNQPYLGSLFKSQNGATWNASQWEDLKFVLHRADFIDSGTLEYYNPPLNSGNGQVPFLMPNPLELSSRKVRIKLDSPLVDTDLKLGNTILQEGSNVTGNYVEGAGEAGPTLSIINAGIGYTPSIDMGGSYTYSNVSLQTITGNGTGALANVTISEGVAIAATISSGGNGYKVGDVVGINSLGTFSTGTNARFSIVSIASTNELVLDNIQGDFVTGIGNTVIFVNNLGITTTLNSTVGGGVNISNISVVSDGLHIKVNHKNHGMYFEDNIVAIEGVESDIIPTKLTSPYTSDSTGPISVENVADFGTFENIGIGTTNFGYVLIGNEVIAYSSTSTGQIGGNIIRAVSGTPRNYPTGTPIYKYELGGISLRRINTIHNLNEVTLENSNNYFDSYNIKIDTSGTYGIDRTDGTSFPKLYVNNSKTSGGRNIRASQNIPYEIITPMVQNVTVRGTSISGQIRTVSGKSIDGNEIPYVDQGFETITLGETNYLDSPRLIASSVNELSYLNSLPDNKSFNMRVLMSTSSSKVSPIIDLQRSNIILTSNRINNPIADYVNDARVNTLTEDPNSFQYISKENVLKTSATSIQVILDAYVNTFADIRVFYAIDTRESSDPIFVPFPGWDNLNSLGLVIDSSQNSGHPDSYVTPTSSLGFESNEITFNEYKFTVDNLPSFKTYRIKIVMSSTNQVYPPRFRNLRAIALA